jgi:hypothetical protein
MPDNDKPTHVSRRDVETCLSLGLTTDSRPERIQAAELTAGVIAERAISPLIEASEVKRFRCARAGTAIWGGYASLLRNGVLIGVGQCAQRTLPTAATVGDVAPE